MANCTILLIDYEPRSIERFRDPLTGAGYAVEIATDGITGIEAFHRLNPDMVLVEAMIPKKHGFEVCQELKRTPHGRRTPVIITTGVYKGRKYRTQALHIYGCDEYIEKPIAPEALLEIVGRFLGAAAGSGRGGDAASAPSPAGGGSSARAHNDPNAKAGTPSEPAPHKPPRATPSAQMDADDGEAEIMARLDAIIPTSELGSSAIERSAIAATTAIVPSANAGLDDPLAQIRAELNAELNAQLSILDEETLDLMPSDHAQAPSVLEALPAPQPAVPKKTEPAAKVEPLRPQQAKKSAEQVTVPESPARRGIPVWVWVLGIVVLGVGIYFLYAASSGDAGHTNVSQLSSAPPKRAETAAPVSNAPVSSTSAVVPPPAAPISTPEPAPVHVQATEPPKASAENHKIVFDTPKATTAVAAKGAPTSKHTSATVLPPPSKPGNAPETSAPAAAAPVVTAPKKTAPVVATTPSSPDDNAGGVESLPNAANAPPSTRVTPGALVPIDEADVLPVSLTRKTPVYSAQTRELDLTGTVVMNVLINERGTVDQVVLVTGVAGGDVNDAAIRAAKTWTYKPATKRGVPVKVWRSEQLEVK
jgi:TonB family protein